MQDTKFSLLWLRQDLRLADNPALHAAAQSPLIAVYIWDEKDPWLPGGAARWWLYKSLQSLQRSFQERGVQLIFKRGEPLKVLQGLAKQTNCSGIYWNRCYEPYVIERDKDIKAFFKSIGIEVKSFKGSLLSEPWELQTQTKEPYKIFSPFWSALQKVVNARPLPIPELQGYQTSILSDSLEAWGWGSEKWTTGIENSWKPGENGAQDSLDRFLEREPGLYPVKRDFPAESMTSRLSPYLHWGELSPSQVWHQVLQTHGTEALPFLRQLGWREFSYHLLFHFPQLPSSPLRPSFKAFPWESNPQALIAWQKGKTGYPLVDAGMRELWHTGWMHNRVRMIVASFLVKDLLLPWQDGEEWFWDTLVDADLANNAANWQWVAGCGTDAAPYFRIFNPTLQSQKFDPEGTYIKRWVPELGKLDSPYIHCPWNAPFHVLEEAGIQLGRTYPFPIIDHDFARKRALEGFAYIN